MWLTGTNACVTDGIDIDNVYIIYGIDDDGEIQVAVVMSQEASIQSLLQLEPQ